MPDASKGLLAEYKANAKAAREDHTTFVDVVEFGEAGAPVRVYGKRPTIKDRSVILAKSQLERGGVDPFEQAVQTVVRLAADAQGDALFTVEDVQFLRTQVDGDVLEALAYRLNAGVSFEVAKKNSLKTSPDDTGSASLNVSE